MLKDHMKKVLGTTFALYIKTSGFHWNVEGPDFPQYHKFFGKIYKEIYGSIDKLAEIIRQLDSYAPGSMTRYMELSAIPEQNKIPRAELMVAELFQDNMVLIEVLNQAFAAAEEENQQGVMDFLASRIDSHQMWAWQLKSTLKKERS